MMASSMGINPDRINMLTFGFGSGIAGIAGVAIGLFSKVTSELGSDYIVQRLQAYKNREEIGNMSSTMWSQSGQLTDAEMQTIGDFIEAGLPSK